MRQTKSFCRFRNHLQNLVLSFTVFFTLQACHKDPSFYEPPTPPVQTGEYEIQENSELDDLTYDMGVHWKSEQGTNCIEFCNFNNRKITVKAILHDDHSFSIPMQDFKSDFWEMQIYQGTGSFTAQGFELSFSAEIYGESFTSQLVAYLKN